MTTLKGDELHQLLNPAGTVVRPLRLNTALPITSRPIPPAFLSATTARPFGSLDIPWTPVPVPPPSAHDARAAASSARPLHVDVAGCADAFHGGAVGVSGFAPHAGAVGACAVAQHADAVGASAVAQHADAEAATSALYVGAVGGSASRIPPIVQALSGTRRVAVINPKRALAFGRPFGACRNVNRIVTEPRGHALILPPPQFLC